jgi:hypothetical protein
MLQAPTEVVLLHGIPVAFFKWSPRIFGILFAAFLAIFALDSHGIGEAMIHLVPSVIVLAVVAAGWRWPLAGGTGFLLLAVTMTAFFHTYRYVGRLLLLSGPLVVVAVLFLLQWWLGRKRA